MSSLIKSNSKSDAHLRLDVLAYSIRFEEILELLLAAGYFRARISKLSRFDRVIGGLSWCITSSAVDVDADIFFQEDAQIGQKM